MRACGKVSVVLIGIAFLVSGCSVLVSNTPSAPALLIDPGHGGFDGGAVAKDGTLEKNINLDIALQLRDMLLVCGVPVTMTRDTDVSTQSDEATTIREKKVSDLKNRLGLYDRASMVISIHQNHYDVSKYSGAQVFYSSNAPESAALAMAVQQSIVAWLQPDNTRQTKKAGDGIYLMYHTATPAILVECGFLSNENELMQLKNAHYRQYMAWAVAMGYFTYLITK